MVTEQEFKTYVKIQKSGVTNMFDVTRVCKLSRGLLTRRTCLEIMDNYERLENQFLKAGK